MNILAQLTDELSVKTAGVVAGSLYIIKSVHELYSKSIENKERKVLSDNLIANTELLRSIREEQTHTRSQLERVVSGVTQLKVISGIPDTDK